MQLQIQNFFIMSEKVLEGGKAFAQIATALLHLAALTENWATVKEVKRKNLTDRRFIKVLRKKTHCICQDKNILY